MSSIGNVSAVCRRLWVAMALVAVLVLSSGVLASGEGLSVAVLDFEDAQVQSNRWWKEHWEVGRQFTELVTNALVGKGSFKVIERTRLEEIMKEQGFQTSGAVDASTAVEIGKLLGVRVLILGSVTEFNLSGISGLSFGGFGLGVQKASVKLNARMVDVQTGEILAAIKGEGTASGGSFAARLAGIGFGTSEFRETTLGKASTQAVAQLVNELTAKIELNAAKLEASAATRLIGKVLAVLSPTQVIIDLGQDKGVRKGQVFNVFRLQVVPGLAAPVRVPVGVIKLQSVDPAAAVAVVTEKSGDFQVGDVVEAQ